METMNGVLRQYLATVVLIRKVSQICLKMVLIAPLIKRFCQIVDPERRYIILKACIQDKVYVLDNVYTPTKIKTK